MTGGWRVHLPTAVETRVWFDCGAVVESAPWPFLRAVGMLESAGAQRLAAVNARGRGRGMPLGASLELGWRGITVRVEQLMLGAATVELAVELPPWDTLVRAEDVEEDALWSLLDELAASVDARAGVIVDGEAPALDALRRGDLAAALRRHCGALVPPDAATAARTAACAYMQLEHSGLVLLLR